MEKNQMIIAALAVLLVASLAGNVYLATRPTTKVPTASDTFIYADTFGSVTSLDPAESYTGASIILTDHCYDTLLTYTGGDTVNVKPWLAESWTVSSDGLVWTFKLKKGVKFASGNDLTAKDVAYSFSRVVSLKESVSFLFTQLGMTNQSTVAVDDYTVKVTLGKKWARSLVEQMFANWQSAIVDSVVVKSHVANNDYGNAWLDRNTAGSGAYKLTTYEPDSKIILDLNPNHWRWSGTTKIREKPQIIKVIGLNVAESATRVLMLEKGDVDCIRYVMQTEVERVMANPQLRYIKEPYTALRFMSMMVLPEFQGKPNPLADNRVRQAIKYALDYTGITGLYPSVMANPIQTIIPSGVPGYEALKPYYRNITLAKKLLADAGYPNGFTLYFPFRDYLDYRMLVEKVQSDLKDIGITLNLEIKTTAELRTITRSRQFQLNMGGFGLDYLDPDACATSFAYVRSVGTDASTVYQPCWVTGWSNLTICDWADEARTMADWSQRAPIYEAIQKEVLDNGPFAFLVEQGYSRYACRTWIENFVVTGIVHQNFKAEDLYKET